jgi:hypothetical protein
MSGALLTLGAAVAGPGCQTRCETLDDCGPGSFCREGRCDSECATDADCRTPIECAASPTTCAPKGLRCSALGQCLDAPGRVVAVPARPGPELEAATDIEGWDDRPGTGRAFVLNELAIAEAGGGLDIDGDCRGPGVCADNALARLGELGNDQIRQGLAGGESLLLVELAGLDVDGKGQFRGEDRTVAVKFYGARDADDPPYAGNNFQRPPGESDCCTFRIDRGSLQGTPLQAEARAPARVSRWRLRSLADATLRFTLTVGRPPHPEVRIERALVQAELASSLQVLRDGLLGGAIPAQTLAATENPYCRALSSLCPRAIQDGTLLDLVATILSPDIDISRPRDGLEQLEVGRTGRVSRCALEDGTVIPPVDPARPWTCALAPEVQDGYSVGLRFSAVAARVIGVGQ